MVDTTISSMAMTYSHSATESVVAILRGTGRDTGLDLPLLEEIAAYFRAVRKKYARFEGSLRGVDSRILVAQVPGGMLTNMENQLREQGAADRMDEVLEEIPRVRKDLGYIALVTPTSQIVGTQAVLNVLSGERYATITKETAGVLRGEYGATTAPVDADLQARILEPGQSPVTCRPADLIAPELENLTVEFRRLASERGIRVAEAEIDDVLTYALFPQVGLKFLENRDNPDAFEPTPGEEVPTPAPETVAPAPAPAQPPGPEAYRVTVDGRTYEVVVAPGGEVTQIQPAAVPSMTSPATPVTVSARARKVPAPLAGNIFKVNVVSGQQVSSGDLIMILEAMKMETEVRSPETGVVLQVLVKEGDTVQVGDILMTVS
jgi:oxaloacetate decarboxylase (Na+ extruding) subunit alpha